MGDTSVSYSLKYNSRCIVAQPADTVNSKWLVGTNALREENEVVALQYDADAEGVVCTHTYTHPAEVWDIAPCPTSEELFLTVWSKAGSYGVSLWHTSQDASTGADTLQQQAELPGHIGVVRSVLWHNQQHDTLVTVDEGFVRRWSLTDSGVECVSSASAGELVQMWCGVLHPRQASVLCTAGGNNVQVWDLRSCQKPTADIPTHKMPTRSISFAPHNEMRMVTSGDDCKLRFWDMRMLTKATDCLLELGGHSHWVWRAAFNPFHDQLVASSSSDSTVNLYYIPQLAASTGGGNDIAAPPPQAIIRTGDLDGKAHTFDEHEDSVYALAWSVCDPWLCATLSYDGRMVINKVPKNIKYKVLI